MELGGIPEEDIELGGIPSPDIELGGIPCPGIEVGGIPGPGIVLGGIPGPDIELGGPIFWPMFCCITFDPPLKDPLDPFDMGGPCGGCGETLPCPFRGSPFI